MKERNAVVQRMDKKFMELMDDIMKERVFKGLAKKNEWSFPESTRLLMRTPSWNKVVSELRTLPKKENLV